MRLPRRLAWRCCLPLLPSAACPWWRLDGAAAMLWDLPSPPPLPPPPSEGTPAAALLEASLLLTSLAAAMAPWPASSPCPW